MGNVNMEAKQIYDRTEAGKHQSVADHLKALDAIAATIENLPTFTSNDRAFLEELPAFPSEDGNKVLTATTSGGATSLSYEEMESGIVDYSTTEQNTGRKWYDGKDIYQKAYTLESPLILESQDWTVSIFAGDGIDTITSAFGVDSNGTYFNFYATKSAGGSGKIGFYQTRNTSLTINAFVLEYTKATV